MGRWSKQSEGEKEKKRVCAGGDDVEGDGNGYSKDIPDAVVKFAGLARSITGRVFWQRAKRWAAAVRQRNGWKQKRKSTMFDSIAEWKVT